MAALSFNYLKPNVPSAVSDMVRLSDAEIDVADFRLILCHDAKMVGGNEIPRRIGRLDGNEP
jgi:hypothetical protein